MPSLKRHLPAIAALAIVNAFICAGLFTSGYLEEFSSVDGAFISIARYLSQHWGDHSWWPLWHCGMPYEDTYVPLLHLVVAGVSTLARISAAHAYHIVVGVMYTLGPVTLYLMAVALGADRGWAFLSSLIYSLFSPSTLLMPDVARDVGGMLFNRRLQVLTVYGEGPHISVMALQPLILIALAYLLRKRSGRAFAMAAVLLALVFLMNVPGTMATGVAVFCWLVVQPAAERRPAWILTAGAAVLAYAIACYGIPPSSELTVLHNVARMHHGFSGAARFTGLLLMGSLAAVGGLGYLLSRTRAPLLLRFAVAYFALTAIVVLTAVKDKFELLPQGGRLQLEMEMAMCLLFGAAGWFLYSRLHWRVQILVVILAAIGAGYQVAHYRESAAGYLKPANLAARSEHATAMWADAHLAGQRVYVTGSDSFWWNTFTDVPQVIGCCDQGESLTVLANVPFLITSATGPYHEILTKAYLQTLGAQAIVVAGPQSTDEYKDIKVPERFDSMLPVLHRELGDTIYAVPQRTASLAHVVKPGEVIPAAGTPYQVYDYSLVIENPLRPAADFQWTGNGEATIHADLTRSDVITVQVPWFSGWKAYIGDRRIPITADGLGFQVLHPASEGPSDIALRWTGRPDRIPSALVSLCALGLTVWLAWKNRALVRLA